VKGDEAHKAGRVSTRRVYTGRIVSLDVDTVRLPNGITTDIEMIRHSGASAIVPFLDDPRDADPRILLIRQYRYAAEGFLHEIPAGRLDPGEGPDDCAHRELKEETGYTARRLERLTTFFTTPGFTDERIHIFAAIDLVPGASELEADEILDLHTMPLSEAIALVERGEIVDGKTIIGLKLAASFCQRA
jgi:ADP-ribose pyrophosphatase